MNGQPTAQNTRETARTATCRVSATGTTPTTSTSWPTCGTSNRRSSCTGRRRPTRCRLGGTPGRGRSSCCGSPARIDLQDLFVLGALLQTTWTVVEQAAQGARDDELHEAV